jgi:mono/diheme cytochrome c family protein
MTRTWLAVCLGVLCTVALPAWAEDPPPPLSRGWRFEERDGAGLYRAICQGCHMDQGQGAVGAGAYPALAGNPRLASAPYVLRMVLHGRKAMPALGRGLDDDQVAQVATYVRQRFGAVPAADAPVTAADAALQRSLTPPP